MTEIRCLYGKVYREPVDAFEALVELESVAPERYSIQQCGANKYYAHYHLVNDGGERRKIACSTKRSLRNKGFVKKKLKEMRRSGRPDLTSYECWYSPRGNEHFHLGNPPGKQTYYRAGHIYG